MRGVMSKPRLLILEAAVIWSEQFCNPWPLLKHLSVTDIKNVSLLLYFKCYRLKFVDCHIFAHDWNVPASREAMLECIKSCNLLFPEETPNIIIGLGLQRAPFFPFLICKILLDTEEMRGFGKAILVPQCAESKLKAIFIPMIHETIELGHKEMIKKGKLEQRIGKIHMLVYHSVKGIIAVKALAGTNQLLINHLTRSWSPNDLVGFKDGDKVCLLDGPSIMSEDREVLTYVAHSGKEAIKAVSCGAKYQAGYGLLPDLEFKVIEVDHTSNHRLHPILRPYP
eukprot:scaffold67813_cov58-Attheya_sp.AAC.1